MPVLNQGSLKDRYKIIPRTLIFITNEEHLLLLKGAPDKRLWANLYNGIGGHIERGEDPLRAAKRELFEETGLDIPNLRLSGVISIDTGKDTGIGIFVFQAESSSKDLTASSEGDLKWVVQDRIYDLPLVEDLSDLLPKILNKKTNGPPFSALYTYNENGQISIVFS
jgi:8-oxo-dGTP diphosphatase